ncbi:MAG TPA: peptidase M28, partial [Terriglobales bacterium]|nr:peptidase M28 [Terriglobales bacterium]
MSASKIAKCAVVMMMGSLMVAQTKAEGKKKSARITDPQIIAAMQKVSPKVLQANDEKLVSFGTRQTLSVKLPDDSPRGIKKAAQWIQEQFENYSKACNGCLEVKTQTETQPVSERIPEPTPITNVYAVLKGTDPESAKRIFVITGHYDS